jgi:uridine kinase
MVVVALSGPSTSGKSTLAEHLAAHFSCSIVALDRFFKDRNAVAQVDILGERQPNRETPESLKWEPFLEALRAAGSQPLVLVDGFILFANAEVAELCDALITLKFEPPDYSIALNRRLTRNPRAFPPNKRSPQVIAAYFEKVIWPEAMGHPEYYDPVGWVKPRLSMRATGDLETIKVRAVQFIEEVLSGQRV